MATDISLRFTNIFKKAHRCKCIILCDNLSNALNYLLSFGNGNQNAT